MDVLLIAILIDFIRKKKFYDNVMHNLETLDKKYLLHELLDPHILRKETSYAKCCINAINPWQMKYLFTEIIPKNIENISKHGYMKLKHRLPRHLWSTKIIKHLPHKACMKKFLNIENFVEQSLYYARSNYVEKDYAIKPCNLKDMVATTLKQHSKQLIENKTAIEMNRLDVTVFTDSKWVQFILGQLILNAIKYQSPKRPLRLTFTAKKKHTMFHF